MTNMGRALLRNNFPGVWAALRSLNRFWRDSPPGKVFTGIYHSNAWGAVESRSGPGSTQDQTHRVRVLLPQLLRDLGARSLLDAPCGDFAWMREVELPVERYIGADVVPGIIERNTAAYADRQRSFQVLDIITDPLPEVDVLLCRDCLVHFSDRRIHAAIRNIRRSKATYLLTTTFPAHGPSGSIVTGEWQPLNLQQPPFNFPPPLRLLDEGCTEGNGAFSDKSLGLWRVADL
jgi:SAM-dependent methyltransferase